MPERCDEIRVEARCLLRTRLLADIPTVKATMAVLLPPGSRLPRHRDPYAGSLRFHLGLIAANSPDCYLNVEGQEYYWRDGEAVVFDETFIHYAENKTDQNRIILFDDVERPMRYRWVRAFNRIFGAVYAARRFGKAFKRKSKLMRLLSDAVYDRLARNAPRKPRKADAGGKIG